MTSLGIDHTTTNGGGVVVGAPVVEHHNKADGDDASPTAFLMMSGSYEVPLVTARPSSAAERGHHHHHESTQQHQQYANGNGRTAVEREGQGGNGHAFEEDFRPNNKATTSRSTIIDHRSDQRGSGGGYGGEGDEDADDEELIIARQRDAFNQLNSTYSHPYRPHLTHHNDDDDYDVYARHGGLTSATVPSKLKQKNNAKLSASYTAGEGGDVAESAKKKKKKKAAAGETATATTTKKRTASSSVGGANGTKKTASGTGAGPSPSSSLLYLTNTNLQVPTMQQRLCASPYLAKVRPLKGGDRGGANTSLRLVAAMDEERELLRRLKALKARQKEVLAMRGGEAQAEAEAEDTHPRNLNGNANAGHGNDDGALDAQQHPRRLPPLQQKPPSSSAKGHQQHQQHQQQHYASSSSGQKIRDRKGLPATNASTRTPQNALSDDNDGGADTAPPLPPPPLPIVLDKETLVLLALLEMDEEASREDVAVLEHGKRRHFKSVFADVELFKRQQQNEEKEKEKKDADHHHNDGWNRAATSSSSGGGGGAGSRRVGQTTGTPKSRSAPLATEGGGAAVPDVPAFIPQSLLDALIMLQVDEEDTRNELYQSLWAERRRHHKLQRTNMQADAVLVQQRLTVRQQQEAEDAAREQRRAELTQRKQLWFALEQLETVEGSERFSLDMMEFRSFVALNLANKEALTRVHEDALRRRLQNDADDRAEMTYITHPDSSKINVERPQSEVRAEMFDAFMEGGWRILRMLQARARKEFCTYEEDRRSPMRKLGLLKQLDYFDDFIQDVAQPQQRRELYAAEAVGWAVIEMELRKVDIARRKAARECVELALSSVTDDKYFRMAVAGPLVQSLMSETLRAVERELLVAASTEEVVAPVLADVLEDALFDQLWANRHRFTRIGRAEDEEDDGDVVDDDADDNPDRAEANVVDEEDEEEEEVDQPAIDAYIKQRRALAMRQRQEREELRSQRFRAASISYAGLLEFAAMDSEEAEGGGGGMGKRELPVHTTPTPRPLLVGEPVGDRTPTSIILDEEAKAAITAFVLDVIAGAAGMVAHADDGTASNGGASLSGAHRSPPISEAAVSQHSETSRSRARSLPSIAVGDGDGTNTTALTARGHEGDGEGEGVAVKAFIRAVVLEALQGRADFNRSHHHQQQPGSVEEEGAKGTEDFLHLPTTPQRIAASIIAVCGVGGAGASSSSQNHANTEMSSSSSPSPSHRHGSVSLLLTAHRNARTQSTIRQIVDEVLLDVAEGRYSAVEGGAMLESWGSTSPTASQGRATPHHHHRQTSPSRADSTTGSLQSKRSGGGAVGGAAARSPLPALSPTSAAALHLASSDEVRAAVTRILEDVFSLPMSARAERIQSLRSLRGVSSAASVVSTHRDTNATNAKVKEEEGSTARRVVLNSPRLVEEEGDNDASASAAAGGGGGVGLPLPLTSVDLSSSSPADDRSQPQQPRPRRVSLSATSVSALGEEHISHGGGDRTSASTSAAVSRNQSQSRLQQQQKRSYRQRSSASSASASAELVRVNTPLLSALSKEVVDTVYAHVLRAVEDHLHGGDACPTNANACSGQRNAAETSSNANEQQQQQQHNHSHHTAVASPIVHAVLEAAFVRLLEEAYTAGAFTNKSGGGAEETASASASASPPATNGGEGVVVALVREALAGITLGAVVDADSELDDGVGVGGEAEDDDGSAGSSPSSPIGQSLLNVDGCTRPPTANPTATAALAGGRRLSSGGERAE